LDLLKKQISGEVREGEADILASEEDKVKILTYHSAKGMEFPVVFLPMLEKQFQYNKQILHDNKYGFALKLERSQEDSKINPFAYQFLKGRDEQNICAEEKRLFYVAATRAKDLLYLLGTISSKGNLPQDSYLYWLFKSYEISEEVLKEGHSAPDSLGNTGFTVLVHRGEGTNSIKKSKIHSVPWEESAIQLKAQDIENIKPLVEKPSFQTYSVTQLMIFREDEKRYVQHFYLNDGKLKLSPTEMEFVDEPGGEMWGSLVHKMLENYYLRSKEDDLDKLRQLAQVFNFNVEDKKTVIQLTDILEKVRAAKFSKSIIPEQASSEFSIELRLENFILKGIFDLLYKNSEGLWEIIDYKTNRIKTAETASLAKKYAFQMRTYGLLLANLYPDQQIYPVSLLFTEPMIKEEFSFNLLEIEETRLETIKLLNKIYQYENKIFHPSSLKRDN
jgi:ATP-dependent helicase/nuclease subunit A